MAITMAVKAIACWRVGQLTCFISLLVSLRYSIIFILLKNPARGYGEIVLQPPKEVKPSQRNYRIS